MWHKIWFQIISCNEMTRKRHRTKTTFTHPSFHLSIHSFIHLPIYSFTHPFIHLLLLVSKVTGRAGVNPTWPDVCQFYCPSQVKTVAYSYSTLSACIKTQTVTLAVQRWQVLLVVSLVVIQFCAAGTLEELFGELVLHFYLFPRRWSKSSSVFPQTTSPDLDLKSIRFN